MTVTWVMLTYNRREIVEESIRHNITTAGDTWDEVVWCDNGSTDGVRETVWSLLKPNVSILNRDNLGVAKGYNRAMAMATGDYIVITGCDMKMPPDWLKTFKTYVREIPETGVACIYSKPLDTVRERIRGAPEIRKDLPLIPALALERRIFPRFLLADVGYFPEFYGLYGFDDIHWAERAQRVCELKGLINYVIPNVIAEHMGTEGVKRHDGTGDKADYHDMKRREALDPQKRRTLDEQRSLSWPKFQPYL